MNCCCSQNTNCECDSCTSQSAFTSPILEVNRGSTLLVEDRNGNPKKLKKKDFALASSIAGGQTELRDGSIQDPINLKFLQELLNGNSVLVKNKQGIVGAAVPVEDDTFLAYVGGVLQFVKTVPRNNVFTTDDLSTLDGKVAVFGCSTSGTNELGFLSTNGDYASIEDGKLVGKYFVDAVDATQLDYIYGVEAGVLKKVAAAEGKALIEENGKWVLKDSIFEEVWVGGSSIWSKYFNSPQEQQYSSETVLFGVGVPNTAKWVQLSINHSCSASGTFGRVTVYINSIPVIVSLMNHAFGTYEGNLCMYVPYSQGSFTVNSAFSIFANDPADTGSGEIKIRVLSYR